MRSLLRLLALTRRGPLLLVGADGVTHRVGSVGVYAAQRGLGYHRGGRWWRYDGPLPVEVRRADGGGLSVRLFDATDGTELVCPPVSGLLVHAGGVRMNGEFADTLAWEPQHWETLQAS